MCLLTLSGGAAGCSFEVRAPTEIKIWCIKKVHLLKIYLKG